MSYTNRIVALVAAVIIVVFTAGVAAAVSTGGYSSGEQDCSGRAFANNRTTPEPGCHASKLNVEDRAGRRYVQAGTDEQAPGENIHSGEVSASPDGSGSDQTGVGFDTHWQPIPAGQCALEDLALYPVSLALFAAGQGPSPCVLDPTAWQAPGQAPTVDPHVSAGSTHVDPSGLADGGDVYFGANDNLDTGEHDGVDGKYGTAQSVDSASDGGDLLLTWDPGAVDAFPDAIEATADGRGPGALAEDPFPVATAGGGACADGACAGVYTARRTIYQGGGGSGAQRNAYDYSGKTWDPQGCSSGSAADEQACADGDADDGGRATDSDRDHDASDTMDGYRQQEAGNVSVEPGVNVYEDPDPQASPAAPVYPLPAAYVGTCGVTAGPASLPTGPLPTPADPPFTNRAGQVAVDPAGCG